MVQTARLLLYFLRCLTSRAGSTAKVENTLKKGRGQMPAYPNITGEDKKELLDFLFDKKPENKSVKNKEKPHAKKYRYVNNGWLQLTDKDGYPGIKPPWGTLNAIDLNKGELLWKVPLGEYVALTKRGIPPTGTQNLGGAVVTAGGLESSPLPAMKSSEYSTSKRVIYCGNTNYRLRVMLRHPRIW